jgi:glycosyltransferase involved in cell wall biosynthesis
MDETPRQDMYIRKPNQAAKPSLTIILPKISADGVAKVGLIESNILDTNVDILSLIKESRLFPTLTKNSNVNYLTKSEILSRLMYTRYLNSINLRSAMIIAHNIPAVTIAYRLFVRDHIPYLAYIHDAEYSGIPGTLPKFGKDEIRKSLENAKTILTNSKHTAAEIETLFHVKGIPLYPGCFPSQSIVRDKCDFCLFVHSIALGNNFEVLYKLLQINKDIKVVIAGGKRYTWQAVYLRFKMKFRKRVNFVFDPTEEVLYQLYRRSKMLLHTYVENFGLSPLEAAANGTPSIVAKGSGVLEILGDSKGILTFDSNNISQLDETVTHYYGDSGKLLCLAEKAWHNAQKFNWGVHGQSLQKIVYEFI